jgi:4'-phosphopantetheinyl transferase
VVGAMMRFIDEREGWDGTLPMVLVMPAGAAAERRAGLRQLVARALDVALPHVAIEHPPERPPIVARPAGSGLHLSSARRGALAVIGAARAPIGVDVETADEAGEIPWNVLHPEEASMLRALQGRPRAMGFARLWSLKEAYLKALGLGLEREPSSFAVRFRDAEAAAIDDPLARIPVADARTTWRSAGAAWNAVSAVVLARDAAEPA